MKKKVLLLVAIFLLGGLAGCGQKESKEIREDLELLEPVDVKMDMAVVQKGDIFQASVYTGEVVPHTEETHFLVDGCLEEIHVLMGDMVQEGDVLAVLSEEDLLEQIEELEEEIADLVKLGEFSDRQAETDLTIAGDELTYMRACGDFGPTSRGKELEIQEMELALRQDRELRSLELEKRQKALQKLQEKKGKNKITAPFNGRIVYIAQVKKGDMVQGYTPLIYIADESRLSLSTEYISETTINNADRVYARILDSEYEISYIPYDTSELVKMTLAEEEIKTNFSIDTEDARLRAGQFAAAVVYHAYKDNVLTVPINALYRDGSGQYVYRQVDGVRVRQTVKTGMISDTKAEIVEGLKEGDIVYVKD